MTNTFANLKPGDPEPNFLHLQRETNKPVGQLQRGYAVMLAFFSGKAPTTLTEAWAAERRAEEEVARTAAEIEAAMRLEGEWRSLLKKRDLLATQIARAQGKLSQINAPAIADAALDEIIIDTTHVATVFTEVMRGKAAPDVRQRITECIERKSAELAKVNADVSTFAKENGIRLDA
jgi:hypothetical protein